MSSATFSLFGRLPQELQIKILKLAANSDPEGGTSGRIAEILEWRRKRIWHYPDSAVILFFNNRPRTLTRFRVMWTSILARQSGLEALREDILMATLGEENFVKEILLRYVEEEIGALNGGLRSLSSEGPLTF